ncbi:MAG: hypothetical protein Q8R95_02045, partial [Azonexus sp.]|nr:hypothetical protein [Azonexus sp.]
QQFHRCISIKNRHPNLQTLHDYYKRISHPPPSRLTSDGYGQPVFIAQNDIRNAILCAGRAYCHHRRFNLGFTMQVARKEKP